MITHDLGVVAETCQRVIVMYAGQKIEEAPVERCSMRRCIPTRGGCCFHPAGRRQGGSAAQ